MIIDIIAFFVFIISFIISIILLFFSLKNPKTRKGSRREILKDWVANRLKGNPQDSIQAIRNQIIVNSAFVSALLVLIGLIIGLYSSIFTDASSFFLKILPNLTLGHTQIFSIGFCIIFSLFSFINANRMATNLTFLITSEIDDESESENSLTLAQDYFRKMQRSWMLGIRGLFFLFVAITWLFHPITLIISTILVLLFVTLVQDFSVFERKR